MSPLDNAVLFVSPAGVFPRERGGMNPLDNAVLYQIANEWHLDTGLTIFGIDLGDAITYDVLRVAGRLVKQHQERKTENGDGRIDPNPQP